MKTQRGTSVTAKRTFLSKWGIVLIVVPLLFATGCDSFLEETPTTIVSPDQFYQNREEAEIALNGVYDMLGKDGTYNTFGVPALGGFHGVDEVVAPPWAGDRRSIHMYILTPTLSPIEDIWADHYEGINRANATIGNVGEMSEDKIDPAAREQIIAEARFLRAFFYFGMAKMFGDVPLLTEEVRDLSDLDVERTPVADVYAQVIEDLQFAEDVLTERQGEGHATKGAAQALLGEVYLQMTGFPLEQEDKFSLAAEQFEKVIGSGVYRLLPNYADVFALDNDNNDEIVFSVQFLTGGVGEGGALGTFFGPAGALEKGGGYGTLFMNTVHATSYDTLDTRFDQNVARINVDDPDEIMEWMGNWRPWKWKKPNPNNLAYDAPFDMPILRYADVLLMYAEALNGASGGPTPAAYDAINQVRARARGDQDPSEVLPPLSGLSQEAFEDALYWERLWELCYEGHRKDDLIRMGRLASTIQDMPDQNWEGAPPEENYEPYHRHWPIPQRDLDLNPNLTQNEGYSGGDGE